MCEIAIVDPERAGLPIIQQIAYKFHEEQGDGIGILAVKESEDGFDYEPYCSTDPHWQTVYSFLRRQVDETWRFVIHGRYATAGAVNRDGAHPISVDCDSCVFDYVIHNGSVRSHEKHRDYLEGEGHHFNTEVDSEVIPHRIAQLPEETDDLDKDSFDIEGNLNYLVFSEDGILAHTTRKYDLTNDFLMTCSRRDFDNPTELGFVNGRKNRWALVTPGEDGPNIDLKAKAWQHYAGNSRSTSASRSGRSSSTSSSSTHPQTGGAGGTNRGTWPSANPNDAGPEDDIEDDEMYTVTYKNHAEHYRDDIIAIKVAPGVMKVMETNTDNETFVFRDESPRLYYWYAPEEQPDNIGKLEELAEVRDHIDTDVLDGEQAGLDDFPGLEDEVEDAIIDEVLREIQTEIDDDVTWGEYAEIEDTIRRAVKSSSDALAS